MEENNQKFGKSNGVIIFHSDVSISVETAIITLDKEREGEGVVFETIVDLWNQSHFSNKSLFIFCKILNFFYCGLDLSRRIVFVKIHNLGILGFLFIKLVKN